MPQHCRTCAHRELAKIEALSVAGQGPSRLAVSFNLPRASVSRHMRVCAKDRIQKALANANGKHERSLLELIHEAGDELIGLAKCAKDAKELTVAVNAWQGRLRALELHGRASGEIAGAGGVTIINQLGVRIDIAKAAVDTVTEAQAMPARAVVERAAQVLRLWNAQCADPAEWVEVTAPRRAQRESEREA